MPKGLELTTLQYFQKILWPLFMDAVQLPLGYRAATRKEFTLSSKEYCCIIVGTNQEVTGIAKVSKITNL